MDLLELDLLHTFVLAVEMKSFAKAAEKVFRSQSAVSLQMQRLEEITGQALFVKQGREWHLTAYGDLLLVYARKMLDMNDQAIHALSETPFTGPVRIGMRIDFSESGLSDVLAGFAKMYPNVQIEITVDKEDVLEQKLRSATLDVVMTFGTKLPDNAILVGSIPLRWIGNTNESIARQEPLPLLLFEAPCLFRDAALEALGKANRNWRPVLTASNVSGMWAAARAGLGIAIRTEIGLPAGCIALTDAAGLPALPDIYIFILKQKRAASPAVELLVEILKSTLTEQLKEIVARAENTSKKNFK